MKQVLLGMLLLLIGCNSEPFPDEGPVEISAQNLWQTFDQDKAQAEGLYRKQMLRIHGTLIKKGLMQVGADQEPFLLLEGSGNTNGILCFFPRSSLSDLEKVALKSSVTIQGYCEGRPDPQGSILVRECRLLRSAIKKE